RIGIDDEMVAFIDWLNRHRQRPPKQYLIVPGVEEMLKQMQGRYPMSVVSARDEKSTMRFLTQFDLCKYFEVIVTALSAPHTKPYPDPILLAAERMGVQPQECLMIGDTTVDMRAGKAAGAQTVGVLCGFGEEPELRQLGADIILKSTADLAALFNQGTPLT
ncbi:MAG TPA: HAD family hydrolase, partial [Anaerolineales bacterium]|nr:HAD family hydrolase [Anaerolineales bacterium]